MSWNWKGFTAIFVIGAALLITGFAVNLYSNSKISGLQSQLQQTGLTATEKATLQGSLNWWQTNRITFYQPLSEMFFIVGLIVIMFSMLFGVLSVWHGTRDQTEQQTFQKIPVNEEPPKTRTVQKTGFPIAAGILAIIAACITIFFAFLALAEIAARLAPYYFEANVPSFIFLLVAGIWNLIAFAFGLTAGIVAIKRKHLALSIVGISLLLVGGVLTVLQTGIFEGGWSYGILTSIPLFVLTMLSLIFVGVSRNEFT